MIQPKMKVPGIVMIGAGNVACHLGIHLFNAGFHIMQVYSRTLRSAEHLAAKTGAQPITDLRKIDASSDVIIFALNDSVLNETIQKVKFSGQLALHTSGTLPIDIFKDKAQFYGVLYPLQTLSKFRNINMHEVPFLIEANSTKELSNVKHLAQSISAKVLITDSLQRRQIHLAAVFASNFSNHMYVIANQLLKKTGFSFDLLKPLILETALKALECGNPSTAQTGPAVRGNTEVMAKHLNMLDTNTDLQNLYTLISEHIVKTHTNSQIS